MTLLKNDLLLRALRNEKVERPPVWMMRQAGRYLPDYIKLREKYDFFTRVQTPALATEITLQPIDQIGVDAAIIFSDILVIPQAMGLTVLLEENKGPVLPKTIISKADVDALITEGVEESLSYVMQALSLTKSALNGRVPFDLFYLGCNFNGRNNRIVNDFVVNVEYGFSTHCYCVSRQAYDYILSMNEKLGLAYDILLTQIQAHFQSYCIMPRIAFQRKGESYIQGKTVDYDRVLK